MGTCVRISNSAAKFCLRPDSMASSTGAVRFSTIRHLDRTVVHPTCSAAGSITTAIGARADLGSAVVDALGHAGVPHCIAFAGKRYNY